MKILNKLGILFDKLESKIGFGMVGIPLFCFLALLGVLGLTGQCTLGTYKKPTPIKTNFEGCDFITFQGTGGFGSPKTIHSPKCPNHKEGE